MDLVCTRYPGHRPSDYLPHLDDYQAFELDTSLALKYTLIDKDEKLDLVTAVQASIKNVVQAMASKKLPKDKARQRLVKSNEELLTDEKPEELPHINDVRAGLMGGSTVLVRKDSDG